ncbi:MAG: hypothetical protein LUE65_04205 [Clostridiales bacterium]|nr:hypothetical protein [Clostridiales bacterium]
MLYDYLRETYGEDEPIFVAEIHYRDQSMNYVRQQIMRMTEMGLLKRYDTGIYFVPSQSESASELSIDKVIDRKYLQSEGQRCGYIGGVAFANQVGLTTQTPTELEIFTNRTANDFRRAKLGSSYLIVRRPKVVVTEQNYRQLQLLDLLKDIDSYTEVQPEDQYQRIVAYMNASHILFHDLRDYLPYYPDRIYKNMYQVGLLEGAMK